MSRGRDFLIYVTELLRERIREVGETIEDVRRDIEGMNEYYWQNYTEMDQYGYEDYDNQQALLAQVNANQENQKVRRRLKKMLDSPFFGSVDFLYDGEDKAETFYIGIGNFARERGSVPLIYDWRAPVSGLFYDHDRGPASYEAPAGLMSGEILSKWQYKIRGGRMLYEFESDVKIDDEILKQELGENSDTRLKNIVRTIQREQNAIIRNTKDRILAIQGAAGSGKTSVALHRVAYLLYHDRKNLHSSNILILSPNSVFADYISHILPELGEEAIRETSLDLLAYRELKDTAADCEDRYHQIERELAPSGWSAEDEARYRWKQSESFAEAAEGFLVELEDRLMDFHDVEFGRFKRTSEEIVRQFYFRFAGTPLLSRMDVVMEYFIDEYETLFGREISEEERELLAEDFRSMYVTTDLYEIYGWLLADCGFPALPECARESRLLAYEDVYPLLYLKCRLRAGMARKNIRHLVIDEMQDYSYLQYAVLEQMFPCNMTILGDRAQTADTGERDVTEFLPRIFGKKLRCISMNKSYRNTAEIAAYAERIAGMEGGWHIQRHGKAVSEIPCRDMEAAAEEIVRQLRLGEGGYETAAVLAMTAREAEAMYELLRQRRGDVSYIDRDSRVFRRGVTVTTFYMAKGLEFDQVFIADDAAGRTLSTNFRYISATRALHELYVMEIETGQKGQV